MDSPEFEPGWRDIAIAVLCGIGAAALYVAFLLWV